MNLHSLIIRFCMKFWRFRISLPVFVCFKSKMRMQFCMVVSIIFAPIMLSNTVSFTSWLWLFIYSKTSSNFWPLFQSHNIFLDHWLSNPVCNHSRGPNRFMFGVFNFRWQNYQTGWLVQPEHFAQCLSYLKPALCAPCTSRLQPVQTAKLSIKINITLPSTT